MSPLCKCGCGQLVLRASKTSSRRKIRKGEWGRYKRGHWGHHTGIAENLSATNRREYMRQWRAINNDKCKTADRAKYQRLRLSVIGHYSHGTMTCACCGESELTFLTIDHIVPVRRKKRGTSDGGTALYSRLRAQGFPNGYQVLCFNCNCGKGIDGQCPHQRYVIAQA